MEYYNLIGLVTKHDPTSENSGTFLCHDVVLSDIIRHRKLIDYNKSFLDRKFHEAIFNNKMFFAIADSKPVGYGLYMRSYHHTKRTVSHDELTSFFCTSFLLDTPHRFQIWKYMLKHFGVYSFSGGKRYLPFQPACYYPWARLSRSYLSNFFLPFYILAMVISLNKSKDKTSSKLLYLDELYCMKKKGKWVDKLLWKYFDYKMKNMYGEKYIKELVNIYFWHEDDSFPLKAKSSLL